MAKAGMSSRMTELSVQTVAQSPLQGAPGELIRRLLYVVTSRFFSF